MKNGGEATRNRLRDMEVAWREERHRSPDEIERDIERTQHEMASTIDQIQQRLRPQALFDSALSYFRGGPSGFLDSVTRVARDHPVPVILTGIGLAWLAAVEGKEAAPSSGTVGGAVSHTGEQLGAAARNVGHKVADAGRRAKERASDLGHRARDYGSRARDLTDRAQRSVRDQYGEHPLTLGALAFAAGALLGTLIPETRSEEEYLRPAREKLVEGAREQLARAEAAVTEKARQRQEELEQRRRGDEPGGGSSSGGWSEPARGPSAARSYEPKSNPRGVQPGSSGAGESGGL